MFKFIENAKVSAKKKLLELTYEFSEDTGFKVNTQNSNKYMHIYLHNMHIFGKNNCI